MIIQKKKENISETKQDIIIGNFEESHIVELKANVKLVPIRLKHSPMYGLLFLQETFYD